MGTTLTGNAIDLAKPIDAATAAVVRDRLLEAVDQIGFRDFADEFLR